MPVQSYDSVNSVNFGFVQYDASFRMWKSLSSTKSMVSPPVPLSFGINVGADTPVASLDYLKGFRRITKGAFVRMNKFADSSIFLLELLFQFGPVNFIHV